MEFSAGQIATIIQAKVEGDTARTVNSFGKIEEARKGQLSFLANPKYEDFLYTTKASIIIINENLQLRHPVEATLLRAVSYTHLDVYKRQVYVRYRQASLSWITKSQYVLFFII